MGNGGRGTVGGRHVKLEELEQKRQGVQVVDEDVLCMVGLAYLKTVLVASWNNFLDRLNMTIFIYSYCKFTRKVCSNEN